MELTNNREQSLGSLGFSNDFSDDFYKKRALDLKRRTARRKNDPTPEDYNMLADLDLLLASVRGPSPDVLFE